MRLWQWRSRCSVCRSPGPSGSAEASLRTPRGGRLAGAGREVSAVRAGMGRVRRTGHGLAVSTIQVSATQERSRVPRLQDLQIQEMEIDMEIPDT